MAIEENDKQFSQIDWSSLQHAHGDASDVPSRLVELGSVDPTQSNAALAWLYDSIWHEGTVYSATLASIPILVKIAEDICVDRSQVLEFLVALAIGCEIDYLPFSFSPSEMVAEWEQKAKRLSKKTLVEASVGPHIDLGVYRAIEQSVGVFHRGLNSTFARHRSASAYGMSWFPNCDESLVLIHSRLENGIESIAELSNTLLAYGFLAFNRAEETDQVLLSTFKEHREKIVRTAAAIASASNGIQDWSQPILDDASRENSLQELYPDILYFDGNLAAYASAVLEERE